MLASPFYYIFLLRIENPLRRRNDPLTNSVCVCLPVCVCGGGAAALMHCLDSFNSFHWLVSRAELLVHVVTPVEQHLERKHTRMYCRSQSGGMQWGRCCLDWHLRNEKAFSCEKSGDRHARRFTVGHKSFQLWYLSIAFRLQLQVTSEDPALDPHVYV